MRTIPALWREAAGRTWSIPAYLVDDSESWRAVSSREAVAQVDELAHGLLALGVRKGDRFAMLGATRLEWALLDWALLSVGAAVVPIYPTSSAEECGYILDHSEAVGIAVEDDEQRAKIESVRSRVPRLRHVLAFARIDELRARGREHAAQDPTAVERAAAAVGEHDLLTCIYTSGTTGPPKGCLLTNRNYAAMVEMLSAVDLMRPGDRTVLFLPLAHNFGRLVHFAAARIGFTLAFCPQVSELGRALGQVHPDFFPAVPRVYEKVHAAVRDQLDLATGAKRRIVDWALQVGGEASRLQEEGRGLPPLLSLQHRIADRLVFSKVKAKLGGRLRFAVSGSAPISREILERFHALDILILEGYGLTEATSCSINRLDRFRFGTIGPPLPGCEVRIAGDGEILVRGDHLFVGYLKNEEATRAALTEDGWFRTGDIGELEDGFLRITDRKKDLIATAGGKKVAPQNIENDLKRRSKYISQALVVGDRRPYIAALVTLDPEELGEWARHEGMNGDLAALARDERVRALIQEAVDAVNAGLARPEQIKRFAILSRDFSPEEGEVTPTLKLKRKVCAEHFAAEIEALYDHRPSG
jgi:long-chain acyl-CoA synthetase